MWFKKGNKPRTGVAIPSRDLGIAPGIRGGWAREQIGMPQVLSMPGRGMPMQRGSGYGTPQNVAPFITAPTKLMVKGVNNPGAYGTRYMPHVVVPIAPPVGRSRRKQNTAYSVTWPGGVSGQGPNTGALGYSGANYLAQAPLGTLGPNVVSPLFGRPGFTYAMSKPAVRLGPIPKLSPGTGRTGSNQNRSRGFVPAAFAQAQHMPIQQFDYAPPNDVVFDVGTQVGMSKVIPRSIDVGIDGVALVGTYRVHDFTPGDRFFKQGRSAANWQDMSFGPEYRYLLSYQQVARYNLYTNTALARPLSPNNYFLGYQTQPAVAQQLGGVVGQGQPLGYASH